MLKNKMPGELVPVDSVAHGSLPELEHSESDKEKHM